MQAIKQAIKQVVYIAYAPHKSLAPLFDSSPAINTPQNLGILKFYGKLPRPFFCHHKEKRKKRSGYARPG